MWSFFDCPPKTGRLKNPGEKMRRALSHSSFLSCSFILALAFSLTLSTEGGSGMQEQKQENPPQTPIFSYVSDNRQLDKIIKSDLKIVQFLYGFQEKINPTSPVAFFVQRYLQHFQDGTGLHDQIEKWVPSSPWSYWSKNLTKTEFKKLVRRTADNPLSVYKLMRRYSRYLPELPEFPELGPFLVNLPTDEEILDAVEGILRIQHIYDLKTEEIATGHLFGVSTGVILDKKDCFMLGESAGEFGFWALAIEWLRLARDMPPDPEHSPNQELIEQETLATTCDLHDINLDNATLTNMDQFFVRPLNMTPENLTSAWEIPKRQRSRMHLQFPDRWHYKANFFALCTGQNFQTEKEKSRLFCWLERQFDKYFWIGPLKMEVISKIPVILRFYDVIGPKMTQKLKGLREIAGSRVQVTRDSREAKPPLPRFRMSTVDPTNSSAAFVEWGQMPVYIRAIETSVSEVNETLGILSIAINTKLRTGLETLGEGSESLYYYSYATDGQIEPHYDQSGADSIETMKIRRRIATFTTYLNDVKLGGLTVFPYAGVSIKPVKGSAIFWFSIYRNIWKFNPFSIHAGCPVILGRKVITTKWIGYERQWKKFSCGLGQNDDFDWNFIRNLYPSLGEIPE